MNSHKSICAEYHKLRQCLLLDGGDNPQSMSRCHLRISRNPFINLYRSYEVTHPNMSIMSVAAHVAKLWGKMDQQERQRFSYKSMLKLRDHKTDSKEQTCSASQQARVALPCDKTTSVTAKGSDISLNPVTTKSAPANISEEKVTNQEASRLGTTNAERADNVARLSVGEERTQDVEMVPSDTLCNLHSDICFGQSEDEHKKVTHRSTFVEPFMQVENKKCQRSPTKNFSFLELPDPVKVEYSKPRHIYNRKAKTKAYEAQKRLRTDIRRVHQKKEKPKSVKPKEPAIKVELARKKRQRENARDNHRPVQEQREAKSKHEKHGKTCNICEEIDMSQRALRKSRKVKNSLGGLTFSTILAKLDREIRALKLHRRTFDNLCETCRNTRIKEEKAKRAKRRHEKKERTHHERPRHERS